MQHFRIFVSSPRDVGSERALAARVIDRLQFEFRGLLDVTPIFWEQMPMRATDTFQAQIPQASASDLCVFILWSWFGTPLPEAFRRSDGRPYASGTEFEFESALDAHTTSGTPDILVYRKTAELRTSIQNREQVMERLAQRDAVQSFIEHYFKGEGGTFKAAFREFSAPADFEEMLETHLRELLRGRLHGDGDGGGGAAPLWTQSPFRGLQAFDLEHALIFCGRTRAVTDALDALRRQGEAGRPLILVIGTSGAGKSSLVRAGLLPLLMQPRVIEDVGTWRHAVFRPSDAAELGPLASLAGALLRETALPELAAGGTDAAALAEILRDKPAALMPSLALTLDRAGERARQAAPELESSGTARLALVVDQLEEVFSPAITPAERDAFVGALSALARSGLVWVMATLRADFYPRCSELPEAFGELIRGDGTYELRPPRPAEIAQMIRRPALIAGLSFERHPESEEGLDDVLRDDAAAHPAALPLLQFALDELYKRRAGHLLRFADYAELGGLEGALRQRAEEEHETLPEPVRAGLPAVLSALVRIGLEDGAIASHRVARSLLAATPGALELADAFVAARLFVADRGDGDGPTIGVAHEALLREWPRARRWTDDNKELLHRQARVAAAAMLWRDSGRDATRLLAPGKGLAEAAAVLAGGGGLLPATAEFIEASLRQAAQRRSRRRLRYAAAATLLLAGIAGAAAYYDAYIDTKVRYYPLFVRRFGVVQGLGSELSADEMRHRNQTYRLSYAGRYGLPKSIEIVNGHGVCAQNLTVQTFLGALNGGGPARECRWELTFKTGKPSGEIAYDTNGQLVYSFLYSDDNATVGAYYSGEGGAIALARSGASGLRFTHIADGPQKGLAGAIHYLNAYGRPQPDRNGSYGSEFRYDDRGFPVRMTAIGADGKPMLPRDQPATMLIKYDARGDVTELDYEDERGRPMKDPTFGAASVAVESDRYGNVSAIELRDADGTPTRGSDGYTRMVRGFDAWGNNTEASFWDRYGQPVRITAGQAKVIRKFDGRGRWIEENYFAEDGAPIAVEGAPRVRVVYDARGHIAEWRYFAADDKPVILPGGYSRLAKTYDAHGNVITETYLDKDGAPVTDTDGAAGARYAYDSGDHLVDQTYLGKSGKPVAVKGGYAEITWVFDDRGNIKKQDYLDAAGKPVAGPNGWASETRSVDDLGDEIAEAYFDVAGRPRPIDVGYSSLAYTYDARGNVTEMAYYAAPGRLLDETKGCPKIDEAYDEFRRMIAWTCRDADGHLMVSPQQGYAKISETYDARGNATEDAYFDDHDALTLVASLGYAALKIAYDTDDNAIEIVFIDASGRPVAPAKYHCAHIVMSYDKGKRVGRRCLDAAAPPTPATAPAAAAPVTPEP